MSLNKNAWLIGLFSSDIDGRIQSLGFKLTQFYPDLNFSLESNERPALIVVSEDIFTPLDRMSRLIKLFPEAVILSVPAHFQASNMWYPEDIDNNLGISVNRLLTTIREREFRWDN
jgi:hypothetical protein